MMIYKLTKIWEGLAPDPAERAQQRVHFFKNVSMLGGLIIASGDTEGQPGSCGAPAGPPRTRAARPGTWRAAHGVRRRWPGPRSPELGLAGAAGPGPVDAVVSLPGSKSLTNRALVLAALAEGPSVVRRALRSRDTLLMAAALTGLGSTVDTAGPDWTVTPGPFDRDAQVDCGLAGTVMRFVPPAAGLSTGTVAFDGDPHMRTRPIGEVLAALRALGVEVADEVATPCRSRSAGTGSVRGGPVVIDASASSQFVSALLLAGARYDHGVDVATTASRCRRSPTST